MAGRLFSLSSSVVFKHGPPPASISLHETDREVSLRTGVFQGGCSHTAAAVSPVALTSNWKPNSRQTSAVCRAARVLLIGDTAIVKTNKQTNKTGKKK